MNRLHFTGFPPGVGTFFLAVFAGLLAGPGTHLEAGPPPDRPDAPAVLLRLTPGEPPGSGVRGLDARSRVRTIPGVLGLEAPFEGLFSGPGDGDGREPLGRTLRVVLEPGSDAAGVARALAASPGVEAAWIEGRYRVSWADGERFLAPAGSPGPGPGRLPGRARAGAGEPDDPLFVDGSQWGLRNTGVGPFGGIAGLDIGALAGWEVARGRTSTPVAIVDTGCDLGQPELGGLLADGSPRIAFAYNSSVEPFGASAWDSVGHGTLVAGVALARTNNGPLLDGRGVAGVAGGAGGDSAGCRVIVVKATPRHETQALSSELAEGIIYAVVHGARAINLSFGGDDDDDTLLDALSYAARRGCVVVCGAGNGQDARPQYPGYYARYGNGISVAALQSDGQLARFSSRGPQIDVAAPGDHIYSTYLTYANAFGSPLRNFAETGGTSFAAPFVTGLAGLVATLQPSITDNEFQQLLRHTARDLGAPGRDDTYGWGLPDAGALLDFAAPPREFVRGTVRAQSWTLAGEDSVTLDKTRLSMFGCTLDGAYRAERWEVRARVDLPGRFLEPPLGLVRTHASNGWGAGPLLEYNLGHGEVVPGSLSRDGFTVRAYVYRIAESPRSCGQSTPIGFVPVRPESVSFGWSAFGLVDTTSGGPGPEPGGFALLAVAPNPARGAVTLRYRLDPSGAAAPGAAIAIHDVRGRRLRVLALGDGVAGQAAWDGRDAAGRRAPSGLYVARLEAGGRAETRRFVLLAPATP